MPPANDRTADANSWHLDKRIPLALVLTIALQTCGAIYFAGKFTSRVEHLEEADRITAARLAIIDNVSRSMGERVAKVETGLADMIEILRRMDGKLDHLQDQRQR